MAKKPAPPTAVPLFRSRPRQASGSAAPTWRPDVDWRDNLHNTLVKLELRTGPRTLQPEVRRVAAIETKMMRLTSFCGLVQYYVVCRRAGSPNFHLRQGPSGARGA
jgi:hypothetical protein